MQGEKGRDESRPYRGRKMRSLWKRAFRPMPNVQNTDYPLRFIGLRLDNIKEDAINRPAAPLGKDIIQQTAHLDIIPLVFGRYRMSARQKRQVLRGEEQSLVPLERIVGSRLLRKP